MIAEIIGLAGAGKTTLINKINLVSLNQFHISPKLPKFRYGVIIVFYMFIKLPFFIRYSKKGQLVNNLQLYSHIRATLFSFKYFAANKDNSIYDQGIIYRIASMKYFGLKKNVSPIDKLLCRLLIEYYKYLDVIISLSIENKEIIERVRMRKTYHMLNEFDDQNKELFIKFYREYYQAAIQLAENNKINVIEIDCNKINQEQVLAIVAAKFNELQVSNK